jgi:hypothetical protein
LRTAWAAQAKPPKPQDAFEMSKQHLDGLAMAARPELKIQIATRNISLCTFL